MSTYIDPATVKPGDVIEYRDKGWPEGDFIRATVTERDGYAETLWNTLRNPDGRLTPTWLAGVLVILSHTPAPRALPTKVGTVIDATVTRNGETKRTRLMLGADGEWAGASQVGGWWAHIPEYIGPDWVLVVDGEGE